MQSMNTELKILNRVVGTSSGWDECDFLSMQFYDFIPAEGFDMPAGTLYVCFEKGIFQVFQDDDSDEIVEKDLMTVMNGLIAVQNRNS